MTTFSCNNYFRNLLIEAGSLPLDKMSKRSTLDMKQNLGKSALFLSINKLRAFSHLGKRTNISLSQSSKPFSLFSLAS